MSFFSRLKYFLPFLIKVNVPYCIYFFLCIVFSMRVFFHGHWRLTGQQGEGGGHLFIPLCHFHHFTNIQAFTCNFACEMTYFYSHRLYLPDCYSIRFTTLSNYHLNDWWCDVSFFFCVSDDLILAFLWDGKPVDSNSHWLSPLYYKRTD